MTFQKYTLSLTLHANRKLEVLTILSASIFILSVGLAFIYWQHDRTPDTSEWCKRNYPEFAIKVPEEDLKQDGDVYRTTGNLTFKRGTYWRDKDGSFFGCICSVKTCIRKCCSYKDGFVVNNGVPKCTYLGDTVVSEKYNKFIKKYGVIDSLNDFTKREKHFDTVYGLKEKCSLLEIPMADGNIYVMSDGRLVIIENDRPTYLDQSKYCWDYRSGSEEATAYECKHTKDIPNHYYFLISVPFFVATFVVYALLPALRNLHGKALMCYLASLTIVYIAMPLSEMSKNLCESSKVACHVLGFINLFSCLAAFFWLNVMCFDVWWMMSGHSSCNNGKGIAAERRRQSRFLLYSFYAWGTPVLLALVTVAMDVPGVPLNYIKPHFFEHSWFDRKESSWLYFFLPTLILLCINALLFGFTRRRLQNLAASSRAIHREDAFRQTPEQERYKMEVRLFLSMGLTWFLELFASVVNDPYVYAVALVTATLQGPMIAYIFLCRRRVINMLRQKFRKSDVPPTAIVTAKTKQNLTLTDSNNISSSSVSFLADDVNLRSCHR